MNGVNFRSSKSFEMKWAVRDIKLSKALLRHISVVKVKPLVSSLEMLMMEYTSIFKFLLLSPTCLETVIPERTDTLALPHGQIAFKSMSNFSQLLKLLPVSVTY